MSTTSMSLESLQFLIQHMDANKRFEIYRRCPSLSELEKSVPLKIRTLVLSDSCVIVNGTTYKLGIIRKYNVGEAPRLVKAINESGGVSYEVDRYGIKDELDPYTVTPGDVEINQRPEQPFIRDDDRTIRAFENQIRNHEARQQQRRRPYQDRTTVERVEKNIEIYRMKLIDYRSRRDNIPPNYEQFFQLTKSRTVNNQEQETIERYIHNKKYSEAMKQLTTVLFGGRSSPIHVTKLKVSCSIGAIRLPVNLKFKTEQLVFSDNNTTSTRVEVLAPILDESSFPLRKLDIRMWSEDEATSIMMETAGFLRIRCILGDYLQTIAAITNRVVQITLSMLTEQTIEELVWYWIEVRFPIGYSYIFDYEYEPRFAFEMEEILKRLNGVPIDEENVVIPMSEVTQIKISYGPFPEFAPTSKWAVRFSTEAIEN